MSCIAMITARGGSKRIPRKNIKEFMGKPMIAYAIEAAINSNVFDEVMVSTDDIEIAEIAKQYGAKVPFMRSDKTSDDFATTVDVIEEVINTYKENGLEFDELCCIYPCVPFLKAETLKNAYEQFNGFDALMPVCKFAVPIEWAMKIENERLIPNDREAQNIRSQDMTPKYFDVGMFYYSTIKSFEESKSLVPDNIKAFIMNETECQDIDTDEDWQMAELKFQLLRNKK